MLFSPYGKDAGSETANLDHLCDLSLRPINAPRLQPHFKKYTRILIKMWTNWRQSQMETTCFTLIRSRSVLILRLPVRSNLKATTSSHYNMKTAVDKHYKSIECKSNDSCWENTRMHACANGPRLTCAEKHSLSEHRVQHCTGTQHCTAALTASHSSVTKSFFVV